MGIANPDLEFLQQGSDPDALTAPSPEEDLIAQQKAQQEAEDEEENLNDIILELVKKAEKEDEDIRWPLLRRCKRNNYYFNNIQKIFFDEVARDYRTIDSAVAELAKFGPVDDIKTVNVYRAFAESLIAALAVEPPAVEFAPDDAENPDDIQSASAYSRISELVSNHNFSNLMLIKALTILFNQGTVAGYNYYKTDPNYGIISTPSKTQDRPIKVFDIKCPQCGQLLDSSLPEQLLPEASNIKCTYCEYQGQPSAIAKQEYVSEVVEYEDTPKGRACFDLFGPVNVKVPLYARKQSDCGYVILRLEENIAKLKTVYKEFRDEITASGGDTYKYERWARIPPEYYGTIPKDIITVRYAYIRPWYFNTLKAEDADLLMEKYPNGLFVSVIDDIIVDKQHDKLDDHWTLSFDPRSDFIHAEPAGNALVPMQDAENDMFNLGIQSIEYGIPETFVHPKTLNLQKYSQTPAAPGMMAPALPPGPDKNLSDGFHTVQTATLSGEYTRFQSFLQAKTQFVTEIPLSEAARAYLTASAELVKPRSPVIVFA
jgi:hypothetical protein